MLCHFWNRTPWGAVGILRTRHITSRQLLVSITQRRLLCPRPPRLCSCCCGAGCSKSRFGILLISFLVLQTSNATPFCSGLDLNPFARCSRSPSVLACPLPQLKVGQCFGAVVEDGQAMQAMQAEQAAGRAAQVSVRLAAGWPTCCVHWTAGMGRAKAGVCPVTAGLQLQVDAEGACERLTMRPRAVRIVRAADS